MTSAGSLLRLAIAIVVAASIISGQAAAAADGPDARRPRVPHPCQEPAAYPFCDVNLSNEDRVRDLVSRFTLEEKARLLVNMGSGSNITRLGLPAYEWWQEALHGVADSPGARFKGRVKSATSFPQPILTAASFNKELFNKIGQVISTEARAMHNENQAGLTFWAPNINIFRDPRWGRGQETPGEDPYLTSIYAEYFVRGMQEDDEYEGQNLRTSGKGPAQLKTSACCKHFTAYDIDQWYDVDRYDFDAKVTQQDLLDTYNPPFQSCIEDGKASSLMCSYNRVNGVPTCADYNLLTKLARGTWGFDGYIVSDCDAVQVMYANSRYAQTPEEAVAYALKAGMDLNCGDTASNFTVEAVHSGLLNTSDIDKALHNSFTVLYRLGYFDGDPLNDPKYGKLDHSNICSPEHQDLALEAALQGIVLLKNDQNTLPLSADKIRSLAVLGPNANDTVNTMLGNYAGPPCVYVTPYLGLAQYVPDASYHPGCDNGTTCEGRSDFIRGAAKVATWTDAVVVVVGLSQDQEREAFDRTSLRLPGQQEELITTVSRVAKGPVILVLMTGGPVDIGFIKDDPKIQSILWVGYPGQAGGQALAQVIFGDRNPGGKLPMSWYPESYTEVPMTDMHMRPDESTGYPGRTYRFYSGDVIYRFGEGMSYTTFSSSFVSAPSVVTASANSRQSCSQRQRDSPNIPCSSADNALVCNSMKIEIVVSVKNDGPVAGTNVVLLYHTSPTAGKDGSPLQKLVGFERLYLESMQEQKALFKVNLCRQLTEAQTDGTWSNLIEGVHTFSLGNSNDPKHEMKLIYEHPS
ncbi:beta-glucosidase [Marchantia polymorpha subsp. ruderalis]|nr:hypothetical protein MARPO_0124s0035 [Marchantia polymorpha]BBN10356.1 hypothetical protein Mp_5g02880 [Marchantia polymorpha subsp. ruderalis]|eukprot:PTQ30462.1 hypothetical protein MARPO_0124s0035 [Marchantia polymorpha]